MLTEDEELCSGSTSCVSSPSCTFSTGSRGRKNIYVIALIEAPLCIFLFEGVLLRLAIETTRYSSGGGIENKTTKRSATKGNSRKMATVSRHRAPKEKDKMKILVRKKNTALERGTLASSDIVSHSANCHYDYAIRAATRKTLWR